MLTTYESTGGPTGAATPSRPLATRFGRPDAQNNAKVFPTLRPATRARTGPSIRQTLEHPGDQQGV